MQTENSDLVASTAFVQAAIEALKEYIGSPLHFKGVVETEEDLHNIENPSIGDVYQVTHSQSGSNAEFVYTENGWIELGTIIDLSGYATIDDLTNAIDTAEENCKVYTDTAVRNAIAEANSYADTVSGTALTDAKAYTDSTAETTLSSAKSYADSIVGTALNDAKAYADSAASSALTDAKGYADEVGTNAINEAKGYTDVSIGSEAERANNYADSVASTALDSSKAYTDNEVAGAVDTVKSYADEVGSSTLIAANEYTNNAIASIEDVYLICKERGYLGTKDEFYDALTEVLNNISNIVINEQLRDGE